MKKHLLFALALCLSMTMFTACSDDDDKEDEDPSAFGVGEQTTLDILSGSFTKYYSSVQSLTYTFDPFEEKKDLETTNGVVTFYGKAHYTFVSTTSTSERDYYFVLDTEKKMYMTYGTIKLYYIDSDNVIKGPYASAFYETLKYKIVNDDEIQFKDSTDEYYSTFNRVD